MGFEGRVVIVTGSGKGIGKCIAKTYAACGAKVAIAEKDPAPGEEVFRSIRETGGEAILCLTDVTRPDDVRELMRKVDETYGGIDILINNAGISIWKPPYELTVEEWDLVLNTTCEAFSSVPARRRRSCENVAGGRL